MRARLPFAPYLLPLTPQLLPLPRLPKAHLHTLAPTSRANEPTFHVAQEWIYHLDSARARVDATKKHDAFKKMYNACLRDHRSKGLDIHNWLQRPNQHLMRQPLLLDALVGSMHHSEHPLPWLPADA